jgi:hypothetical protein
VLIHVERLHATRALICKRYPLSRQHRNRRQQDKRHRFRKGAKPARESPPIEFPRRSFFAVPYAGLTIEASEAGPDRIGVMSARTAFANLSQIVISWIYWFG